MSFQVFLKVVAVAALTSVSFIPASVNGQTVFDFEGPDALSHPAIGGDVSRFAASSEFAHGGTKSLRFADTSLEPHESWTYDLPMNLTSGTVSVWFYDVRGASAYVPHSQTAAARWGGSVILEDKNNPADFGAVEIAELPYGPKYYASEGSVNRGNANTDSFDSDSLPARATGFHKIEFHITPNDSKIFVDGVQSDEAAGPGSSGNNLRLRFMYDSPSNGGRSGSTWVEAPETESRGKVNNAGRVPDWIYYDQVTITSELPNAQTHVLDFEIAGETPDYDFPGEFLGPDNGYIPPHDNPNMNGFVNQWAAVTTATAARSGAAAARFVNEPAPYKSIEFDLAAAQAGTSVTLWFYDPSGPEGAYETAKTASVIIENGANPSDFHAIEVTSMPFPNGGPYRYPLTKGSEAGGPAGTIFSKALMPRIVGWHEVEIGLYETYSLLSVDGQVARYATPSQDFGVAQGPGLNKAPKLRIMGDSATAGGVDDYTKVNLLTASFQATREPFAFFDDISIPITNASVNDWMNY